MPTITVSRQLGSLGFDASRQAAELLGYRLIYRELINKAARRAGAPEMALAAIDEFGLLNLCPDAETCLAYRKAVEQVMKELVGHGNTIIIGRAGQVILRDNPGVIHLRIWAPTQVRAERISERQNISIECAHAQIAASDRFRQRYLQRFYQERWDDPKLYDFIINTARITSHQAARIIVNFVNEWHLEQVHNHVNHRKTSPLPIHK